MANTARRITLPTRNGNFVFIVSTLLILLQLKPDSPFETHPKTMRIALTSLLIYGLAHDAEQRFSLTLNYENINVVRQLMELFGSLLLASLASVLFPDSVQPVIYLLYIMLSAGALLKWLKQRVMSEIGDSDISIRGMGQYLMNIWRREAHINQRNRLPI